ncbi:hypothetical protein TNCV_1302511 [Trichonephila clavipes]|nr:hypothetical protein TNCV_1302511 [Trichonephila clavipes]
MSKFPKQKPKKGETQTLKTPINQRPVTPDVRFANVCSNKIENQMALREEAPKTSNQSPIEKGKNPDNAESYFKFEKFATYINELQNNYIQVPRNFPGAGRYVKN